MILFLCGLFISSLYSYWILPPKEGGEPTLKYTLFPLLYKSMIIIPLNHNKAIHIHHWVIYWLIFCLSLVITTPTIITGFSIGLFIQGIQYKDSFQFVCNNPYYTVNQ